MSYEEEVRRKHEFEAAVRLFEYQIGAFIKQCKRYEREGLELAMARLLDNIQKTTDLEVIIDAKFKISLTKTVLDERIRGQKKSFGSFFAIHWSDLAAWRFTYPCPLTESSLDDFTVKYSNGIRLLGE
jgi:hypothetical protein